MVSGQLFKANGVCIEGCQAQWEVRRLYRSLPINVGYVD